MASSPWPGAGGPPFAGSPAPPYPGPPPAAAPAMAPPEAPRATESPVKPPSPAPSEKRMRKCLAPGSPGDLALTTEELRNASPAQAAAIALNFSLVLDFISWVLVAACTGGLLAKTGELAWAVHVNATYSTAPEVDIFTGAWGTCYGPAGMGNSELICVSNTQQQWAWTLFGKAFLIAAIPLTALAWTTLFITPCMSCTSLRGMFGFGMTVGIGLIGAFAWFAVFGMTVYQGVAMDRYAAPYQSRYWGGGFGIGLAATVIAFLSAVIKIASIIVFALHPPGSEKRAAPLSNGADKPNDVPPLLFTAATDPSKPFPHTSVELSAPSSASLEDSLSSAGTDRSNSILASLPPNAQAVLDARIRAQLDAFAPQFAAHVRESMPDATAEEQQAAYEAMREDYAAQLKAYAAAAVTEHRRRGSMGAASVSGMGRIAGGFGPPPGMGQVPTAAPPAFLAGGRGGMPPPPFMAQAPQQAYGAPVGGAPDPEEARLLAAEVQMAAMAGISASVSDPSGPGAAPSAYTAGRPPSPLAASQPSTYSSQPAQTYSAPTVAPQDPDEARLLAAEARMAAMAAAAGQGTSPPAGKGASPSPYGTQPAPTTAGYTAGQMSPASPAPDHVYLAQPQQADPEEARLLAAEARMAAAAGMASPPAASADAATSPYSAWEPSPVSPDQQAPYSTDQQRTYPAPTVSAPLDPDEARLLAAEARMAAAAGMPAPSPNSGGSATPPSASRQPSAYSPEPPQTYPPPTVSAPLDPDEARLLAAEARMAAAAGMASPTGLPSSPYSGRPDTPPSASQQPSPYSSEPPQTYPAPTVAAAQDPDEARLLAAEARMAAAAQRASPSGAPPAPPVAASLAQPNPYSAIPPQAYSSSPPDPDEARLLAAEARMAAAAQGAGQAAPAGSGSAPFSGAQPASPPAAQPTGPASPYGQLQDAEARLAAALQRTGGTVPVPDLQQPSAASAIQQAYSSAPPSPYGGLQDAEARLAAAMARMGGSVGAPQPLNGAPPPGQAPPPLPFPPSSSSIYPGTPGQSAYSLAGYGTGTSQAGYYGAGGTGT